MAVKIVQQKRGALPRPAKEGGSFRLGDAVAAVAKPVAHVLGIEDCLPCQQRKAYLNAVGARAGTRIRSLFRKRTATQSAP